MMVGPYAVTIESPVAGVLNFVDAWRVRLFGVPRAPGSTPQEIARGALRRNARHVLHAGEGHFWFMWVSDFGKSLRGAWDVLGADYLGAQIDLMTSESFRLGYVPSCFDRWHGFDMPWPRGDSLPWLLFSQAERLRRTDRALDPKARAALQCLLDRWESTHFEAGLIAKSITGDWVDTVRRPSSTYNNLCALMALREAKVLGLSSRADADAFAARLLADRWRGDHFRDHAETEALSVDSAALALYLGLFDRDLLQKAAHRICAEGFDRPWPIRCASVPHERAHLPPLTRLVPGYHNAAWLHLGAMWLNGLRRLGREVSEGRMAIENLINRHGHVLEVVDQDGSPYRALILASERGLSMAAAQYLELAN